MEEIIHYISIELANPEAAKQLGRKIFDKINNIRKFPDSGVPVDNEFLTDKSLRKLLVGNYIIYYQAHHPTQTIYIVRIIYGKRNLDEVFRTF